MAEETVADWVEEAEGGGETAGEMGAGAWMAELAA